jgi:hypothetical protein
LVGILCGDQEELHNIQNIALGNVTSSGTFTEKYITSEK